MKVTLAYLLVTLDYIDESNNGMVISHFGLTSMTLWNMMEKECCLFFYAMFMYWIVAIPFMGAEEFRLIFSQCWWFGATLSLVFGFIRRLFTTEIIRITCFIQRIINQFLRIQRGHFFEGRMV